MCEQHFFANRKKMENLWSKENREIFPRYIDLFVNVANECKTAFAQWNHRLTLADWKHKFLVIERPDSTNVNYRMK